MINKVLCVVAHPDDEALGCGGALAKLAKNGAQIKLLIIADGESSRGEVNHQLIFQRQKQCNLASSILGIASTDFLGYKDNQLDVYPLLELIQRIENSLLEFKPDLVITHHYSDLNIDHQLVNKAVITACRPSVKFQVKKIWAFEIISSTEWGVGAGQFRPNLFIDIESEISIKMKALECYDFEMRKHPETRSLENVLGLCKYRGSNVAIQYAEAFEIVRELYA